MTQVTAISILVLTIGLSLGRPRVGQLTIGHAVAAVLGALLCVILGVLPAAAALKAVAFLVVPLITITSLMVITLVAEQAGLFEFIAFAMARAARGSGMALFTYIFFVGSLTGTVFTNDTAVLIFTPLVVGLIKQVQGPNWTSNNKLPFYFAVLYVANVVGALVISNPINIIVSRYFNISFLDYARWMILPATVSIITTYFGLRFFFRHDIPQTIQPYQQVDFSHRNHTAMVICGMVMFLTLLAFFSEPFTGIPVWQVAPASALLMLILHGFLSTSGYQPIATGIGWDVLIFVVGIFIVASGIQNSGLTDKLGEQLLYFSGGSQFGLIGATSITASGLAAIMNNHPSADTMAMVVQDMGLPASDTKIAALASLIGGDLGPKMLPTGSLAALMWFRILRARGIHISYWTYIKIGVPVTIAAVVLSVATLCVELQLSG